MKLAVVFPGIGYHVDKPLLFYSKKIAASHGFEIVEVPYGNFPTDVKGLGEDEGGFSKCAATVGRDLA